MEVLSIIDLNSCNPGDVIHTVLLTAEFNAVSLFHATTRVRLGGANAKRTIVTLTAEDVAFALLCRPDLPGRVWRSTSVLPAPRPELELEAHLE